MAALNVVKLVVKPRSVTTLQFVKIRVICGKASTLNGYTTLRENS
jgi:hypothetical protein